MVLEPDDGRRAVFRPRRPDHLVVVLDHFGLLAEHEAEGPRQVADVERLVVLVQNEHDTVHRGRRIAERRFVLGGAALPVSRAPVGGAGRRVPAAGLADLRRERPAERVGDEPRGVEDARRATTPCSQPDASRR